MEDWGGKRSIDHYVLGKTLGIGSFGKVKREASHIQEDPGWELAAHYRPHAGPWRWSRPPDAAALRRAGRYPRVSPWGQRAAPWLWKDHLAWRLRVRVRGVRSSGGAVSGAEGPRWCAVAVHKETSIKVAIKVLNKKKVQQLDMNDKVFPRSTRISDVTHLLSSQCVSSRRRSLFGLINLARPGSFPQRSWRMCTACPACQLEDSRSTRGGHTYLSRLLF